MAEAHRRHRDLALDPRVSCSVKPCPPFSTPRGSSLNAKPRGRQLFFNPGPTNIPDRVLRAMDRPVLDFLCEEFLAIHRACQAGLKRVLKTGQHLFVYAA